MKVSGLNIIKAAGTDPAVSATGGKLALTDSAVIATAGDAIAVSGAENVIQRASILDTAAADGADGIAMGVGGLQVDSSVVLGGAKGAAVRVTTTQGSDPATVTLNHVSTAGTGGIVLDAAAPAVQLQKVGDITLAVNASIVRGTSTATAAPGTKDPLLQTQLIAPTVVKATFTNSDASEFKGADGKVVAGTGNATADSALYRAGTALRLKATAPVIDKGGALVTGESDKDIDGEPRTNGAATDIGADEFTNHPPTLELSLTPTAGKTGQIVTATGLAKDAEGADDVKGFFVDWGDGKKDTTASSVVQHAYEKSGHLHGDDAGRRPELRHLRRRHQDDHGHGRPAAAAAGHDAQAERHRPARQGQEGQDLPHQGRGRRRVGPDVGRAGDHQEGLEVQAVQRQEARQRRLHRLQVRQGQAQRAPGSP